ncbi:hypothetical protein TorRG33x02_153080 [Trema orientale]|uniref:Uncharacterized protein n=1 Tax=Trema orientale TaxID=63057 RepID=A0A2P5ETU3_TREOI|nr:hypothetical protein TorRG33x02_153080 [Trema orientale]
MAAARQFMAAAWKSKTCRALNPRAVAAGEIGFGCSERRVLEVSGAEAAAWNKKSWLQRDFAVEKRGLQVLV